MFCVYSVTKYRAESECTGKGILHLFKYKDHLISLLLCKAKRSFKKKKEQKTQRDENTLEIAEISVRLLTMLLTLSLRSKTQNPKRAIRT